MGLKEKLGIDSVEADEDTQARAVEFPSLHDFDHGVIPSVRMWLLLHCSSLAVFSIHVKFQQHDTRKSLGR